MEEYEKENENILKKAELNKKVEAMAKENVLFIPTYYSNIKRVLCWKYIRLPRWNVPLYMDDLCQYFAPFAWFDAKIKEDVEKAFEIDQGFEKREWK